jgi:hypothetical protein
MSGQLEAVNRDLQSKSWANLKLLGQPCNFYARGENGVRLAHTMQVGPRINQCHAAATTATMTIVV